MKELEQAWMYKGIAPSGGTFGGKRRQIRTTCSIGSCQEQPEWVCTHRAAGGTTDLRWMTRELCVKHAILFAERHGIDMPRAGGQGDAVHPDPDPTEKQ